MKYGVKNELRLGALGYRLAGWFDQMEEDYVDAMDRLGLAPWDDVVCEIPKEDFVRIWVWERI
jgi:hypothetical protein